MCGRYVLRTVLRDVARDFGLGFDIEETDVPMEQRPRFNIAPTHLVPVIRVVDGGRRLSLLRWGLIPWWSKGETKPQINARGETVFEKPMFRDAAKQRRCLLLADGYYEWKRDERDRPLQAYFVERADGRAFVMAGLWESWVSPDGEVIETVAVITTEANGDIAPIHHRMPVIPDRRDYLTWLEGSPEEAKALIKPPAEGVMVARMVGNRVGQVRNDDASNLDPPDPNESSPAPKGVDPRQGDLF